MMTIQTRMGNKTLWFQMNISLQLQNGTRQGHSYCGRLIH